MTSSPANALIHEKSPYLLQHAKNPVHWFPWGQEAFEKAKQEDKPIFLSIGYATCHWCHVMAHESFEDPEIAQILNDHFVSIKVDREERPDVDKIYMSVCQALTGQGGWPLSVFLTPEGNPFFAGTYFPKTPRMGITSFPDLLNRIADLWREDRSRLITTGDQVTMQLHKFSQSSPAEQGLGEETLQEAGQQLGRAFDSRWGGFGKAPKFPSPHQLTFLLRHHRRTQEEFYLEMVEKTLRSMRRGGIFDHLGYGFHRYSVDERWFAPHFEKMLYDQALLAMAYIETYQVTGKPEYAQVAREVFTYVLRDMTAPKGGFYSAEDADSEGKEGLFYLWTPQEVKEILGPEPAELFCSFYDISQDGNFEDGRSIPHITNTVSEFARRRNQDVKGLETLLAEARRTLLREREKRVHPLKDDKILTAWNGLMTVALLKGYRALGDMSYLQAAQKALSFILDNLQPREGYVLRRYRENEAAHPGYLDDYAFLIWALVEAFQTAFDPVYLEQALTFTHSMVDQFWDQQSSGFFFTGRENEVLITRTKDAQDGAIPSGNSVAALNLLQLARLTGDNQLEDKASALVQLFARDISEYPTAHTQMLQALDFMIGPSREVVVAGGPDTKGVRAMMEFIHRKFLPNQVTLLVSGDYSQDRLFEFVPFVRGMTTVDGKATAYVCQQFACRSPITDLTELKRVLD